jgi:translation initiation factor 2-alpha kinase 4
VPKGEMCGAGFSFSLDRLVQALQLPNKEYEPIEVIICISGSRPPLQDVVQILRSLWTAGIKTGLIETINYEEEISKDICTKHIIMLGEGGVLRVRSWSEDRFIEKSVSRPELIDYIQKMLRPESSVTENLLCYTNSTTNIPAIKNSNNVQNLTSSTPSLDLVFKLSEKVNTSKKRRLENQVEQKLQPILSKFCKKEKITVIMVDLPSSPLRALVGIIDPAALDNDETSQNSVELKDLIDRFPKYKKNIIEIYSEIVDYLSENKNPPIVGIFSVVDAFCRLIL